MSDLKLVAILWMPFFVGLLAHALCLHFDWLRRLQRPLDRGSRVRGRPLFGANKTVRGVAAVALGTAIGYALEAAVGLLPGGVAPSLSIGQFAFIGVLVGAAGMLGELPISLLKRQLDIAPGATTPGVVAPFIWLLDQVDVPAGGWLVLGPIVGFSASRLGWSVVLVGAMRQLLSFADARLGARASTR